MSIYLGMLRGCVILHTYQYILLVYILLLVSPSGDLFTEMEAGLCNTGHAADGADGAGSHPRIKAELNMRIILT